MVPAIFRVAGAFSPPWAIGNPMGVFPDGPAADRPIQAAPISDNSG
jgi:hypothetical protein